MRTRPDVVCCGVMRSEMEQGKYLLDCEAGTNLTGVQQRLSQGSSYAACTDPLSERMDPV
jgi:hypothetical protein